MVGGVYGRCGVVVVWFVEMEYGIEFVFVIILYFNMEGISVLGMLWRFIFVMKDFVLVCFNLIL